MSRLTNERSIIVPYHRHEPGTQPPAPYEPYKSTVKRSPTKPLIFLPHTLSEVTGPVYGHDPIAETDNDLTRQHKGEPQGERIIVTGRVLDSNGRPVPNTLVEIWQANAAGRYLHQRDQHPAPLDPNFSGAGRTLTDENGAYRFVTIKPGAYPWFNHYNASLSDEKARQRMVSKFDLETTQPQWALGYKFDIVLRGPEATPFEA
jgi:protocatechuate 3,4-dioxygenase beta subunit